MQAHTPPPQVTPSQLTQASHKKPSEETSYARAVATPTPPSTRFMVLYLLLGKGKMMTAAFVTCIFFFSFDELGYMDVMNGPHLP